MNFLLNYQNRSLRRSKFLFAIILSHFILNSAQIFAPAHAAATLSSVMWFPGVNLSGGEYNPSRTRLWKDYAYPNTKEIDYYASHGMKLFRIPFLANRLIGSPQSQGGLLSTPDMEIVLSLIHYAAEKDTWVLLDMHEYGVHSGGLIGRDPSATVEFASDWGKIAERVKDRSNVIFGLMNEPHSQSAKEWLRGANAAIAAIRGAGAKQLILVPGSYWDGAHSWCKTDNENAMLGVVDIMNNYAYEVHQYLDLDSSGTKPEVAEGAGRSQLVAFTNWARANRKRGFLGEFGWAATVQAQKEGEDLVAFVAGNKDVWLGFAYWTGGPWTDKYMFSIEPQDGMDRQQFGILRRYAK